MDAANNHLEFKNCNFQPERAFKIVEVNSRWGGALSRRRWSSARGIKTDSTTRESQFSSTVRGGESTVVVEVFKLDDGNSFVNINAD